MKYVGSFCYMPLLINLELYVSVDFKLQVDSVRACSDLAKRSSNLPRKKLSLSIGADSPGFIRALCVTTPV